MKVISDEQARRGIYVSWINFNAQYEVGTKPNESRRRCEAFMKKHGIDMSNANAYGSAMAACQNLWFLQLGVSRVTSPLSANAFIAAVNRLGYSYTSVFAYYNFFSPERHDGNAGERVMRFDDGCKCFKYVTGAYKI